MPGIQTCLAALYFVVALTDARAVFAHYMVGSLDSTTDHAIRDIDDAQALGFDAFALNSGAPTQTYATNAIDQLFKHAEQSGFKLFFCMDTSGGWQFSDWSGLLSTYSGSDAYYKGPNGKPFVSSFDNTNVFSPQQWADFKASQDMYLIPDIDHSDKYYSDTNAWLSTWGSIVDGVFSWETAWPAAGDAPANVSIQPDESVMSDIHSASKSYMIPISALQYKHWPQNNQHWYRVGESNLPQRMEEILSLGASGPDFAEYITWNDAGESHYIGNVWDESIGGAEWIYDFANSTTWSHAGWQPLLASFITAFKAGGDSSSMAPPSGSAGVGAMWYRTILKDARCSNDPLGKPSSAGSAQDAVNWAVVLPAGPSGCTARVTSGSTVVKDNIAVGPGLTYESTPGMVVGPQMVELLDDQNNVILSARSDMDVRADSSGICNFNYQVAGMQAG